MPSLRRQHGRVERTLELESGSARKFGVQVYGDQDENRGFPIGVSLFSKGDATHVKVVQAWKLLLIDRYETLEATQ